MTATGTVQRFKVRERAIAVQLIANSVRGFVVAG